MADTEEHFGYFGTQNEMERAEVISKLLGYCSRVDVVHAMLDDANYTKNGRMNRSAICRATGVSSQTLDSVLAEMREILEDEFDFDIPKPKPKVKLCRQPVVEDLVKPIRSHKATSIE